MAQYGSMQCIKHHILLLNIVASYDGSMHGSMLSGMNIMLLNAVHQAAIWLCIMH